MFIPAEQIGCANDCAVKLAPEGVNYGLRGEERPRHLTYHLIGEKHIGFYLWAAPEGVICLRIPAVLFFLSADPVEFSQYFFLGILTENTKEVQVEVEFLLLSSSRCGNW